MRLPLILSALALALAATGVTPSEAARAVSRALNAARVDGLSASRTTEAGRFDTLTVLRALCSARSAGSAQMPDIRLRAIRLGSLTEQ